MVKKSRTNRQKKSTPTCGEELFKLRKVIFLDGEVPSLLQNRNGPCALLAVANCLLLRGVLKLDNDLTDLSSRDLVKCLQELARLGDMPDDPNNRANVLEVTRRLPQLMDGLLLNCRFSDGSDFEPTADLGLFDCFDIRLFHAWVAPEIAAVTASWNALAEELALCAELGLELETTGRQPLVQEEVKLARGIQLRTWFEDTAAQATHLGLQRLLEDVKVGEVCVLFRNNHFSTVYKPSPNTICTLVTDSSFEDEPGAVWETVELDCGAGQILGHDFLPCVSDNGLDYFASSGSSDSSFEVSCGAPICRNLRC